MKKFPFVDYVFFGEADEIFAEVCGNILSGKENFQLPYGVLRRGDPLPEKFPHRLTQNMENLPCPNYKDYFNALKSANILIDNPDRNKNLQAAYDKVRHSVKQWYLLYNVYVSKKFPCVGKRYNFSDRLEQRDSGEVLEILDLRKCHVKCRYELKNAEREIHLLCRSPISRKTIYNALENNYNFETTDKILERLIVQRLSEQRLTVPFAKAANRAIFPRIHLNTINFESDNMADAVALIVVLEGFEGNFACLNDPAVGRRKIPFEDKCKIGCLK